MKNCLFIMCIYIVAYTYAREVNNSRTYPENRKGNAQDTTEEKQQEEVLSITGMVEPTTKLAPEPWLTITLVDEEILDNVEERKNIRRAIPGQDFGPATTYTGDEDNTKVSFTVYEDAEENEKTENDSIEWYYEKFPSTRNKKMVRFDMKSEEALTAVASTILRCSWLLYLAYIMCVYTQIRI